jgi:uncharacterized membrane protein YdbT with pleckstrin-like domain
MVNTDGRLGLKTFALLLINRSGSAIVFIIAILLAFFGPAVVPLQFQGMVGTVATWGVFLGMIIIAGAVGISWLEYTHYNILTDEDGVKITRGTIAEETLGVPYRRVREARIERSVSDEILGASTLILTVTGEEGAAGSEVVLHSLDKQFAVDLQEAILKKAEVEEEVNVTNKQT